MWDIISGDIPIPVSEIWTWICSGEHWRVMETSPPSGVNLMALFSRLIQTWRISSSFPT